ELEQQPRFGVLNRSVEDLTLLVAHVDEHAARRAELVDRVDYVARVSRPRVLEDVLQTRRLAPVADLPLARQPAHAQHHPHRRPAQHRHPPAAYLEHASHRLPRTARRSTPGWRATFGPSSSAKNVVASHGRR